MKHCTLAADRPFLDNRSSTALRPARSFSGLPLKIIFPPAVGPALFIDPDERKLDETEVDGCELIVTGHAAPTLLIFFEKIARPRYAYDADNG
jgi:hypothetical protein